MLPEVERLTFHIDLCTHLDPRRCLIQPRWRNAVLNYYYANVLFKGFLARSTNQLTHSKTRVLGAGVQGTGSSHVLNKFEM